MSLSDGYKYFFSCNFFSDVHFSIFLQYKEEE